MEKQLAMLTAKELQQRCKAAGLKSTGKKQVLIERLEFHSAHTSLQNEWRQRVVDLETTINRLTTRSNNVRSDNNPVAQISQQHEFVPQAESSPQREPVVSTVNIVQTPVVTSEAAALTGNRRVHVSTMPIVQNSDLYYAGVGGLPQQMLAGNTAQYVNTGFVPPRANVPQYMLPGGVQPVYRAAPPGCHTAYTVNPALAAHLTYGPPQMDNLGSSFSNIKEMVAILPEFNPVDENSLTAIQFVQRVQTLKNAYQWRDDMLIFAVQQKVRGHAKLWVDAQNEIFTSWQEFATKLTSAFPFDTNSASAHIKMANSKRELREAPSNYYFRMLTLGTKYGLPESAIARHIINGINDHDLRKKISNDYEICVDLLKDIEAYCRFNAIRTSTTTASTSNEVPAKDKTVRVQTFTNRHIKCYNCGKYGHFAAKCSELRKDERKREVEPTKRQVNKVEALNAEKSGIVKTIMINGKAVKALVDPGSASTLIRTTLANGLGVSSPCNVSLNGFGGGQYICRSKMAAEIGIDDQKLNTDCLLVDNELLEHDALVGRDVLCRQGTRVVIQEDDCWLERAEEVVKTAVDLQPEDERKLKQLLANNRQCFAETISELGTCSIRKMDIKLLSTVPINVKPYRLEFAKREKVRKMIDELLSAKIIRSSESSYASPVVVVPKKNDEIRLCVDYRQLNKITQKLPFPMPIIDEHLAKLAGNKYFTVMDLRMGYHQVEIEETAKKYTAFVTVDGHFEYNRMPFGLVNAPAVFQAIMNTIVDRMGEDTILAYLDDVVIPSRTVDDGLRCLEKFLGVLRDTGFTLRLEKCSFLTREITYLGHNINAEGITPGDKNLSAVRNFPVPENISEVRRFLGLTGFFRKFIGNYAIISKPLTLLLHKAERANFRWEEPQQRAFAELTDALCMKPVLTLYDFNAHHEVHTDASSLGLAGVMLQSVDSKDWRPVCYFSRQCSNTESRYHAYELEVLAVVETLTRFRIYLLGKPFRLVTDCSAIAKAREKKELIPKISRWYMRLMEFNFEATHRPAHRLAHVDALSRAPNEPASEPQSAGFVMSVTVGDDDWLLTMQLQDADLANIISVLKGETKSEQVSQIHVDYKLHNSRLYRNQDGLKFVVPKSVRWRIVKLCHDDVGHFGLEKTLERVNKNFWFKRMRKYAKDYIAACADCCYNKVRGGMPEGRLYSAEIEPYPFVTIHIDHLGPFVKSARGMCYVIAMSDAFTKYIVVKPVRNTKTSPVIAALNDVSSYFGLPRRVISDRGTAFTSKAFAQYCSQNNIRHIKTAVRSPRANGQVERANQTILNFLRTTTNRPKDWDLKLRDLQWSVNSQKNKTSGFSPNELLFDFNIRDVVQNKILAAVQEDTADSKDIPIAEKRLLAAERIQNERERWKKRFDHKHKQPTKYEVNDLVVTTYDAPATGESRKLSPKYRGPYVISRVLDHDRYVVSDIPGMQVTQRSFDSVFASENLKPWCGSCPELDPDSTDDETSTEDDAESGLAELSVS